jgi:RNA polymerase sigma-70 factor (ECF subfamily)
MNARVSLNQLWDFAVPADVDSSQEWVLSAMKVHGPDLIKMLWRILGCEQEVCDAYQETFLKLAHYNFCTKPDKVKSYVFKTASNVAISILRRKKTHQKYVQKITQTEKVQQNDLRDFDHDQTSQQLRDLVAKLPQHLGDVIVLRDFGELSYHQVAKLLNITEQTARVYRCKAVQLLAIWLNDEQIQ